MTLLSVTLDCKRRVTPCAEQPATVREMEDSRRKSKLFSERLAWARESAGYAVAADAARKVGAGEQAYRSWEKEKPDGRRPSFEDAAKCAKLFNVDTDWLISGKGSPERQKSLEEWAALFIEQVDQVPREKRDDAIDAALGVVGAYTKKAKGEAA